MRHGYTNQTEPEGCSVRKVYRGPDAAARQQQEAMALRALRGHVPVPELLDCGDDWIRMRLVEGEHGQDLIEAGRAEQVLVGCGRTLRVLHSLDPHLLTAAPPGDVVVHGDFGPNNLLFLPRGEAVKAVLDWEFCGVGPAIRDLAWCEWIVRMHHPGAVLHLASFFAAYGTTPPWADRQAEMVRRCRELERFASRWDPNGPGVAQWRRWTAAVEGWTEGAGG